MIAVYALSSFRKRGEMKPHNGLAVTYSGADGKSEVIRAANQAVHDKTVSL